MELWGGHECTISRTDDQYSDQSRRTGHSAREDDLLRFAGLGIKALRYPLLWEAFCEADDKRAFWQWHAERLTWLRQHGVNPIIGLIHHGSGPPSTNLLSDDFATGLAEHAAEVAARFPWVTHWTPVNEPLTTARFSALYGHWFPHRSDERDFWTALINQVDASRLAMDAIRAVSPQAKLVQTEDLGHSSATTERQAQADFDNERRWASWDLLSGTVIPGHYFWDRLVDMGFEHRLETIAERPCPPDILGINHYLTSDRFLDHRTELYPSEFAGDSAVGPLADIEAVRVEGEAPGLEGALRACWARYHLPIALTEVHNGCTREEQMRWLLEAWNTATALKDEGLDIRAVTAWSLLGAYDWNSLLTRNADHYESGVFDIRAPRPRETAMAPLMRSLAASEAPAHPVLAQAGWWRRTARLLWASGKVHTEADDPDVQPLLVVGASGTLGQAFVGACRLRNIACVSCDRQMLDLNDPHAPGALLDHVRPWAVINCAGWVRVDEAELEPDQCMAVNVTGNVGLAAACEERDIHFTTFSSDLVFDGGGTRPYLESDALRPLNIYGKSKAMADRMLGRRSALVIRTASFFSPHDRHNFAVHLADALVAETRFKAANDCISSPTYVPDLVRATLDLIIDGETGLWHLTNAHGLSWSSFAFAIAEALRLPTKRIVPTPAAEMGWRAKRPEMAALGSERGLLLPPLESAVHRFASSLAL